MEAGRSTFERRLRQTLAYRRHAFLWRSKVPVLLARAAIGCEIHLIQPGAIANITIRPQEMSSWDPAFNEAIINVQAAGLNFRDVLNVLGVDPTGTLRSIGGEAAGIVSAVGHACAHVLPSERAYSLASGSLRTRVLCDARYIRCMARTLEPVAA